MRCDRFHSQLSAFVRGELEEPTFGEMVEHEAACPACHFLAAEGSAAADWVTDSSERSHMFAQAGAEEGATIESILARTTGTDCDYVQRRLADRLDSPLPEALAERLEPHLAGCASCRRMRDVLLELPSFYQAMPALHADRAFTRGVLRRTLGPRPRFLEVVRALWARPEAMWEATAAMALLLALLFGSSVPRYQDVRDQVQVMEQRAGVEGLRSALDALLSGSNGGLARLTALPALWMGQGWRALEERAEGVSAWMTRSSDALEKRDYQGLLRELEIVLKPLGLSPDSGETGPVPGQPEGENHELREP